MRLSRFVPAIYIILLLLPIYWLLNMSFKTTNEILGGFTLYPHTFTFDNYNKIFTDPSWYMGYVNSLSYVVLNTIISLLAALPAAYAFSRYRFIGDKQDRIDGVEQVVREGVWTKLDGVAKHPKPRGDEGYTQRHPIERLSVQSRGRDGGWRGRRANRRHVLADAGEQIGRTLVVWHLDLEERLRPRVIVVT